MPDASDSSSVQLEIIDSVASRLFIYNLLLVLLDWNSADVVVKYVHAWGKKIHSIVL